MARISKAMLAWKGEDMQYDFSAQFLRILAPDTTFGEAWESLCEVLLRSELAAASIVRLRSPDRGVDILCRSENTAFQCKSSERGAFGRIGAASSIQSLRTAVRHKDSLEWLKYCFATNTDYTGASYEKIIARAKKLGLSSDQLEFFGPAYWDSLCTAHSDAVRDRFDYRVTVRERELYAALKKVTAKIMPASLSAMGVDEAMPIVLTNNLNSVEVELPLLESLTAEEHIKAMLELLGLSEFLLGDSHLGIALTPLFSLRFRGNELRGVLSVLDLDIRPGDKLELHLKLGLEALAAYDTFRESSPDDVGVLIGRAEVLVSIGDLDEALRNYQMIVDQYPENVLAATGRAEVLKAMGRLADSEAAYDAVIAVHPQDVVAKTGRAEVLKAMGRLVEAEAAFDAIIALHPEDVVVKNGRAEVLKAQGRLEVAEVKASDEESLLNDSEMEDAEAKGQRTPGPETAAANEFIQAQARVDLASLLQDTIWKAARRLLVLNEDDARNGFDNSHPYWTDPNSSDPYGSDPRPLAS
jgi:Flp pilus assembly protein TadD